MLKRGAMLTQRKMHTEWVRCVLTYGNETGIKCGMAKKAGKNENENVSVFKSWIKREW